jgi:error-prone DNA polymerase
MSRPPPRFAELAVTTNFSFLRGGSHPEELVQRATELGLAGLGVADRNTVAGVVRAHVAAKEAGLRLAPGARLAFADGTPDILAYPVDRRGWGRLCRLLSIGNNRAEKGSCILQLADLADHTEGLCLVLIPPRRHDAPLKGLLETLRDLAAGRLWLAAPAGYRGDDQRRLARLAATAAAARVPLIATAEPLYHVPERRPLQDVLTCIRLHTTLAAAGRRLEANAERHLKPAAEMARLFRDHPEAVAETIALLSRLGFSLDELRYEYPDEAVAGFASPQAALAALTEAGARERYPEGVPEKVRAAIAHELAIVAELGYAPYFLTVHDIVRHARRLGILAQGRGSAANSAICFCLGITEVDPARADLLFERFISPERREPPDIDVDFEHERREEIIQYIYARYGRHRAGLAATLITYRTRSAVRETAKVFGLSDDVIARLNGTVWGSSGSGLDARDARRAGLDPSDPRLARVLALARELIGFPRHLSQHVGGFVLTRGRLDELVPIGPAAMAGRTFIEWDKDDLDALGILKIDILALGMLTAIRKAFDFLERHYGEKLTIASIPAEDPSVYRMLWRADSLGVFQVESRAQMTMLPRLRPQNFYDLVIEVAIVRPGPIQGDMVHPYLRRRQGLEPVVFPSKELEEVLGKTLGVPLFQEQAMRIAITAAGFTPAEADKLRRAMATFRRVGTIGTFQAKMIEGMVARGYERAFAERCFRQIEGFGEYGFPESHAASFALLVYASCWLKCHYPDVFAAALLDSQPMGFYAPAQILRDAREHGVEVRPVDINHSEWRTRLEPGPRAAEHLSRRHAEMAQDIRSTHAIRLGFQQIVGFSEESARRLVEARRNGYDSVRDLWLRSGLSTAVLEQLADADAFRSLGLDRRAALWAIRGLGRAGDKDNLPLLAFAQGAAVEPDVALAPMPPDAHVVADYRHLRLSLKAHPMAFARNALAGRGFIPAEALAATPTGARVRVAGLVTVRQRPGTASGVIFMTIEDETAVANVIVWPKVFETFRAVVLGARAVGVSGRVQNESGVIHVVSERLEDLTAMLGRHLEGARGVESLARADEVRRPGRELRKPARHPVPDDTCRDDGPHFVGKERGHALAHAARALPGGRNFR